MVFVSTGFIKRLCLLINQCSALEGSHRRIPSGTEQGEQKRRSRFLGRRNSGTTSAASRGIGYGRGSTKSRWDIERTVEERIAQEEHLMWLLCALTTFMWGDAMKLGEMDRAEVEKMEKPHLCDDVVREVAASAVLPLLEYHLTNDSVFDVSQHMDFYQVP